MQRRAVGSYVRKASKPPKWSQPAWPRASHRHLSCGMAIRLSTWQIASPLRFEMTIKLTLDRVHFDHPANWRD